MEASFASHPLWLDTNPTYSMPDDMPGLSYSSSSSKTSNTSPSSSRHPSPLGKLISPSNSLLPELSALSPAALDLSSISHSKQLSKVSDLSSSVSYSSAASEADEDSIERPPNFDEVNPGLYRSSFPKAHHFNFLRSLGLKTVVNFTQDPYPHANTEFLEEEGIAFLQIGMPGNKEETIKVEPASIEEALRVVLNPANYPLLMHCNKGRHRTGCVVGCLRKLQNWDIEQILEEYRQFSAPKSRSIDQQCIRIFKVDAVWESIKEKPRPTWLNANYKPELYHECQKTTLKHEATVTMTFQS